MVVTIYTLGPVLNTLRVSINRLLDSSCPRLGVEAVWLLWVGGGGELPNHRHEVVLRELVVYAPFQCSYALFKCGLAHGL